ncbi:hypothetical protein L5L77_21965 [Shewanella sp. SM29]|nr:hypothetical protein [Shewanella sp. SM29]
MQREKSRGFIPHFEYLTHKYSIYRFVAIAGESYILCGFIGGSVDCGFIYDAMI